MKHNTQVSIGISAYNEEKNIAHVLKDILKQEQKEWSIQEIFVYSDGSSDKTVANAKKVKSKYIKIIDDKSRKGKTARIQQMFENMSGEIMVMFDADIKIASREVITQLLKAFAKNKNTMLVGGNTIPFLPKNFFQRGVYATFKVFYQSRIHIQNGSNLFACTGGCLAIRRKFAKEIIFPAIKNEDTYLYFSAKKKGYQFTFVPEAIVYYKLPNTLPDYLAQIFRSNPEAVNINLTKHFGELVKNEYNRGNIFYVKNVLKVFLEDPLPVSYIIAVNAISKPLFPFLSKSNKRTWDAVTSTK